MSRRIPLHVYHRPPFTPAHRGNSFRGLREAIDTHHNAIDLDALLSADGVWMNLHWQILAKDGYRDPKGIYDLRETPVHEIPAADLLRFRAKDRNGRTYRIRTMRQMFRRINRLANRTGVRLTACVELKVEWRFGVTDTYDSLLADAGRYKVPLIVMSQPRGGVGVRYLHAAQDAGAATMLMQRGPVTAEQRAAVRYIKTGPIVRAAR